VEAGHGGVSVVPATLEPIIWRIMGSRLAWAVHQDWSKKKRERKKEEKKEERKKEK
jgi:hypothetical protein